MLISGTGFLIGKYLHVEPRTFGRIIFYILYPALVLDFYSKAWPEPTGWHWDFGDGNTSDEANPTHIFNLPIVKDSIPGDPNPFRKVCLTVKTATGCVATWCETIDIYVTEVKPDTTNVQNRPTFTQCATNQASRYKCRRAQDGQKPRFT